MSEFKKFLGDCFKTSGRLSRQRYAKAIFLICLPTSVGWILERLVFGELELGARFPHVLMFVRVITYSVTAFTCIAIPCLTARRFHDIGKSGWWGWIPFLTPFFPGGIIVGFLLVGWLARKDGEPGKNKYGDPPDD